VRTIVMLQRVVHIKITTELSVFKQLLKKWEPVSFTVLYRPSTVADGAGDVGVNGKIRIYMLRKRA
jgi:hypothetical protein